MAVTLFRLFAPSAPQPRGPAKSFGPSDDRSHARPGAAGASCFRPFYEREDAVVSDASIIQTREDVKQACLGDLYTPPPFPYPQRAPPRSDPVVIRPSPIEGAPQLKRRGLLAILRSLIENLICWLARIKD